MSKLSLILVVVLLGGCATRKNSEDAVTSVSKSGRKIETTIKNRFYTSAQVVINLTSFDAWEYETVTAGESIVVSIYKRVYSVGTFDGVSSREVVFQIPSTIQEGDIVELKSPPQSRKGTKKGDYQYLARMEDAELTAFKYGNPWMGWMKKPDLAMVEVVSRSETQLVLRLRLKGALSPQYRFDLDEIVTANLFKIPE